MQVSDKTVTYCLWIVNNGAGILTDEKLIGLGRRAVYKYVPTPVLPCSVAYPRLYYSTQGEWEARLSS